MYECFKWKCRNLVIEAIRVCKRLWANVQNQQIPCHFLMRRAKNDVAMWSLTAWGEKLLCSLVVWKSIHLYRLIDCSSVDSTQLWWVVFLSIHSLLVNQNLAQVAFLCLMQNYCCFWAAAFVLQRFRCLTSMTSSLSSLFEIQPMMVGYTNWPSSIEVMNRLPGLISST